MGKSKKERALKEISRLAEREYKHFTMDELTSMLESNEANTRLFALLLMRKQIKEGTSPDDYLELARSVINDPDNNCRWQSLIVVSESLELKSDLIWEVIAEYGDSDDNDMRTAIATILLEHLLDYDFEKYFNKTRSEILKGRYRFLDTLGMCWFGSKSDFKYKKVQSFLKNAKRGLGGDQRAS